MPTYQIKFHTAADWAETEIDAETAVHALYRAHALEKDELWSLDFARYDSTGDVEHIQVCDATGKTVAEWHNPDLLQRLAADDLLEALEQAVAALNTAPRFRVPALDSDSYTVAARCEAAIHKAKIGTA